jgi:hypothetical protein
MDYSIDIRSWLNLDGQLQEVAKDYSDDDVLWSQWVEKMTPVCFATNESLRLLPTNASHDHQDES